MEWALKAMGRAVEAMQHASGITELCQSCCDAIIADSPYTLAWIGLVAENDSYNIDIVAKAGQKQSYLDGLQVSWGNEPIGRGPAGTAIRTGKTQVLNDALHSETFTPWTDRAAEAQLAAVISLPLISRSRCLGVLLVYSERAHAFDAGTVSILESLAGVTSLSISLHQATTEVSAQRLRSSAIQDAQMRTLQLLNLIVNTSNDTIFAKGIDGRYLLCNQEFLRQLDRSSEEVIGKTDSDLHPPGQAAEIIERDNFVFSHQYPITFEEEILTTDGLRTFTTTKGPLHSESGEIIGLFGISRDITDQKRSVAALQNSEARYRRFAEELSLGMVITQDGLVKYVNKSTCRMIGYSEQEIVGKSFLPFVCEVDRPRMIEQHQRRMRGEHIDTPFILGMQRKDGTVRQWQFNTSTIEWDGKISGLAIMADITEKVVHDEMLRTAITEKNMALQRALHSETRYKALIQHAADALYVHDLEGYIVEANRQACDSLGYSQEELCRMHLSDIVPHFDLPGKRELWENITPGKPISFTSMHRRKDGSTFPVELRIARLELGEQTLLMAFATDITARIRSENELLSSFRKLEEKELSKTRFLAAAGHDLRQPIAAATLFIDTLRYTAPTSMQSEVIDKLDQSMQVFSNQLERLLDISKLDAGVIKPQVTTYSLCQLIDWLEQTFAQQAQDKGLRFRIAFPSAHPLSVTTDIGLLQSVLMNLVSNAIKYTEQGGILITARPRQDAVLLQVWDTGIGISEEHISKVFDEFYQVGNPQRNRDAGLGLGLSIGKRAMALLGSQITCRSRFGRGSVFSVDLPLSDAARSLGSLPATSPAHPHHRRTRFSGKRVLLLEDDALVASALVSLLESLDAKVTHFHTAEDALSLHDILDAELFIVDYALEGKMTGLEFLTNIQLKHPKKIKAVIITGETSSGFIAQTAYSPWRILHKPISYDALAAGLEDGV